MDVCVCSRNTLGYSHSCIRNVYEMGETVPVRGMEQHEETGLR